MIRILDFFLVFGVLHYQTCTKYALSPDEDEDDVHHIDVLSGQIYMPTKKVWIKHADFCLDFHDNGNDNDTEEMITLRCFSDEDKPQMNWFKFIPLLISTVCLGLTLITFFILPSVTFCSYATIM
jgi:hypothetical protein